MSSPPPRRSSSSASPTRGAPGRDAVGRRAPAGGARAGPCCRGRPCAPRRADDRARHRPPAGRPRARRAAPARARAHGGVDDARPHARRSVRRRARAARRRSRAGRRRGVRPRPHPASIRRRWYGAHGQRVVPADGPGRRTGALERRERRASDGRPGQSPRPRIPGPIGCTVAKSLVLVNTGDGKGKSTAAFGVVMRAVAPGLEGRRRAVPEVGGVAGRRGEDRQRARRRVVRDRRGLHLGLGRPERGRGASPARRGTQAADAHPRRRAPTRRARRDHLSDELGLDRHGRVVGDDPQTRPDA